MDTLIEYYEYDSGNFELFTFFRLSYDAQSRMQAAELHVYDGVSAFFHAGTFDFYYNANNATALDSVKLVSQIGVPIDLLRIHYILRGNGEISRINIKEDTAFTGIYYTTAYEIPKYAAGKIYELQQIIYDDDSGDFETELVTRFLKRNSGIGLDEEKAKENISIYPNPAKDHISINGITQNTDYTIINIIGEKIKSGMITQAELIDVKDLLPGVYIIQIDTGDRIVGKRFEKL